MTRSLDKFRKGDRLTPAPIDLSLEPVLAYEDAVDDSFTSAFGYFVPPMALTALSIRSLLDRASLPSGAIHVGQEVSFNRSVEVGEELTAQAAVVSRGERQGWVLMGIDLTLRDRLGMDVMTGRATITFPLAPGEQKAP
jgi:acyl dehydratase